MMPSLSGVYKEVRVESVPLGGVKHVAFGWVVEGFEEDVLVDTAYNQNAVSSQIDGCRTAEKNLFSVHFGSGKRTGA